MFEVLKDFKGSPDGHTVIAYTKGEEVELVESLAKVALAEKWVRHSKSAEKVAKEKAKAEADAKAAAEAEAAALRGLYGSSVAPAVLQAPNGKEALLGDLVRTAFEESDLSGVEWNEMADNDREQLISDEAARFIANNQVTE